MRDYHVLPLNNVMEGDVTDHGVILDVEQVPWAEKQMWDNDVVEKDGKWYLFHHDCVPSDGITHLRSLKVVPIEYDKDGKIIPPTVG